MEEYKDVDSHGCFALPDMAASAPQTCKRCLMAQTSLAEPGAAHDTHSKNIWALALGSIGVVFGDIGTSPLYAFKEALHAAGEAKLPLVPAVYGILSLIFWTLILIVTLKYVLMLLRADNKGEGGTFSLMSLAQNAAQSPISRRRFSNKSPRR